MTHARLGEVEELLKYLTTDEQREISALLRPALWVPLPGPQLMAYNSEADVIGFGGAAGGGKTDLGVGKALTQHARSIIFRREGTEIAAIEDRITELLGSADGYNSQKRIWRPPALLGKQIEFGSVPNLGDEKKYQGRPHDLVVFDEAPNFLEIQVRFLLGWLRTVSEGQKCQALMTFNPPTDVQGRWIVTYFAPWLDDSHPDYPATPGELRWYAVIDGKDIEVASSSPFYFHGERITPQSRTFIPSRVDENPFLINTGYVATLQALPEPLRSQMLRGDFNAGMQDDIWQLCPTAWVDAAMERWIKPVRLAPMDSVGVDVARGGSNETVIARRHDMWFDEPLAYPGAETPDGPATAGLIVASRRDDAVVHIDAIGVGSSPYDFLTAMEVQTVGVIVSEATDERDANNLLCFYNVRSLLAWRMREALDPMNNTGIALPPDRQLKNELCAFTWHPRMDKIYVSSRDEVIEKTGRSPDYASAYFLALMKTPKLKGLISASKSRNRGDYDPYDSLKNVPV